MQKLTVRHAFACTPATFWEMFWDDDYDRMVLEAADVRREILESTEHSQGVVVQKIRTTPNRELPKAVAAVVGAAKLIYTQDSRFDPNASTLTWSVTPNVLADKVTAKGQLTVRATPSGCERLVDGEIAVNVRFVGGRIEKAIVDDVSRSYAKAAEVAQAWLTDRPDRCV